MRSCCFWVARTVITPLSAFMITEAAARKVLWRTSVVPVAWLIAKDPALVDGFMNFAGKNNAAQVDLTAIMLGAGVCLSLIMQIGEQIDYLRFMPPKTAENSKSWWLAVFSAGPGWVILGAIKQIIGAFLGFYLLTRFPAVHNTEPVQQFVSVFDNLVPGWLALTLAVVLVVGVGLAMAYPNLPDVSELADYRHSPHHAIEMINRPVSSFERGTSNGQNSRNRVTKQAAQLVSSSGALV